VRLLLGWYGIMAVLLVVALLPGGWAWFFARDTGGVAWTVPWAWSVVVSAAALVALPPVQMLSGTGRIAEGARAQAIQKVVASAALCLFLAAGGRLLSWPAAQTLGIVVIGFILVVACRRPIIDLVRTTGGPTVSWWHEVWPFQWKVAVGGLAYYLTSQLFTLVLFDKTEAGKAEAGRMGASLYVMNVLVSGALMWIGARVPQFGQLVARRDWPGLDRVFRRVFIQSTLVAVLAAFATWLVFLILRATGIPPGNRVLSAAAFGLLMGNVVVQTMVQALISYLRAHKREPFLAVNLLYSAAVVAAAFLIGRLAGSLGMAAALLILNTTICLGAGGLVFVRCRRAWHSEPAVGAPDAVPA
jgi:O-antigen/teichoic acid export membrane protein